ncbi:MAG: hypothetical protein U0572_08940 [Phycisphaerales bacterium]
MKLAVAAITGIVALGGCSAAPTLDASRARDAGPGAVVADDLRPAPAGTVRWRSVSGLLEGCEFDVVTDASTVAGATNATRTADVETAHWSVAPDGSVVLVAVDSHPDRTRSVFEPPLLLAPPTLPLQQPVEVESSMRAVLIANPESERDRGSGHRTVRYVGTESIMVNGAQREAQVVEVDFIAELRNAKAERHSRLWVVPGDGIVAEEWAETLTILKVFTKRSNQTAMRLGVELPARDSPPPSASESRASANSRGATGEQSTRSASTPSAASTR